MQAAFDTARIALTVIFLVYASWRDYKVREVSDKVWIVFAPIALALSLATFFLYDISQLTHFGISVGITVGFALLLFYTGGFGGADSKAFICIAFALPFFPTSIITPLFNEGISPLSQIIFSITILSNSVLVAALSALYLLLRNLAKRIISGQDLFEGTLSKESIGKKILVLITGQKFSLDVLKAKWHIYPMEDAEEINNTNQLERKLVIVPKDEGREEILERLSKASQAGKIGSMIWATPGLPMLIFVTAGVMLALTVGDLVWLLVAAIIG
jgi:preflagellin peptidase FlaK